MTTEGTDKKNRYKVNNYLDSVISCVLFEKRNCITTKQTLLLFVIYKNNNEMSDILWQYL